MRKLYVWHTTIGPFYIAQHEGYFHVLYDDVSLGGYMRPEMAAEAIAGGHAFSVSSGVDTATLDISENLSEWEKLASTTG